MRSYFLNAIPDMAAAGAELDRLLPGQRQPWLLEVRPGDPIAYFSIYETNVDFEGPGDPSGPGPLVQADVSGRHQDQDEAVLELLRRLQKVVGGLVMDDGGAPA